MLRRGDEVDDMRGEGAAVLRVVPRFLEGRVRRELVTALEGDL